MNVDCIYSRPEEEFDVRNVWNVPDVPPLNNVLRNLGTSSNLHLVTEEPYTSAVEQMVRNKSRIKIF